MTKTENSNDPIIEGMMDRRVVVLNGQVNSESVKDVGRRLLTLQMNSSDPINLIIDSVGGSTYLALSLCDLITAMITAPIRAVVMGDCGSAATFVLLHCKERVSTRYSRFLIHSGTVDKVSLPINQTTSENMELLLLELKETEDEVLKLYTRLLTPDAWAQKQPTDKDRRAYVRRLINRGDQRFHSWMTAQEAKQVGLIQKIIHKLEIFPA